MRSILQKENRYTMDSAAADKALQNVLNSCGGNTETMTVKTCTETSVPKTASYTIGRWLALLMLFLTFLFPLAFPHSKTALQITDQGSYTELSLDSHYVLNDNLYLQFYGEPLDVSKCYMLTADGYHYTSIYYDEKNNLIAFPFGEESANIYIEGQNGSILHLIMNPQTSSL